LPVRASGIVQGVKSDKPKRTYEAFLKHVRRVKLVEAFAEACHAYGVTLEDAYGDKQTKARAHARAACWKIMRDRGQSYPEIADFWARDHTTVMHAVKKDDVNTVLARHLRLCKEVRDFASIIRTLDDVHPGVGAALARMLKLTESED